MDVTPTVVVLATAVGFQAFPDNARIAEADNCVTVMVWAAAPGKNFKRRERKKLTDKEVCKEIYKKALTHYT